MKRKSYSADFKSRVAIDAIKGAMTISQIAARFEVHPNQVSQWKKQGVQNLKEGFTRKRAPKEKKEEELYRQIGQLTVELRWVKKKFRRCPLTISDR